MKPEYQMFLMFNLFEPFPHSVPVPACLVGHESLLLVTVKDTWMCILSPPCHRAPAGTDLSKSFLSSQTNCQWESKSAPSTKLSLHLFTLMAERAGLSSSPDQTQIVLSSPPVCTPQRQEAEMIQTGSDWNNGIKVSEDPSWIRTDCVYFTFITLW